jgi:uncharacterized protein
MSDAQAQPRPDGVPSFDPVPPLAAELALPERSVAATVRLLAEGCTVPFIARYRKEATGGLDEVQIRAVEERHGYLLELDKRRQTILGSIAEQGKLSAELRERILGCRTKTELEDLYLPFKPKRRTRATAARERGLEPLAGRILDQPDSGSPQAEAEVFVDAEKGVGSAAEALAGARDIVAEQMAENADVRALTREAFFHEGFLATAAVPEKAQEPTKFKDYYNYREAIARVPSHRFLAVRRGENEGVLRLALELDTERMYRRVLARLGHRKASPFAGELEAAVQDGLRRLLLPSVETDVRLELKLRSDRDAVEIFASNLRHLLLASPLGPKGVVGIDPGLRTGCKCVAVDQTGKFLDNVTIYPHQGEGGAERARRDLLAFVLKHRPVALAVGNGTAGRETEAFVRAALAAEGLREVVVVTVNEAGASVYSASELAREEFPDLDVTVRGAISIARRLQDPLAELVKIDPKSIGVGQYQHDVHQPLLARKLEEVVESCVNHVGVELNTASAPLLAYVAGIGPKLARKIVEHREANGTFRGRRQLLEVSGLGPRTFEQAAGFLRVRGGEHPLDASAVHPERYELVQRMAGDLGVELDMLVGNATLASTLDISRYLDESVGEPTLRDIVAELRKPGRDPRAEFEQPRFREDVAALEDLEPGMQLEGVVTNVTGFGAFVDVGVHQDGLVHISQLADRFVKDPHEVVRAGDKIRVRVLEVDLARRRIALSARSAEAQRSSPQPPVSKQSRSPQQRPQEPPKKAPALPQRKPPSDGLSYNPFADALKRK